MRSRRLVQAITAYWQAHASDTTALERASWGVRWMGPVEGAPGMWASKFIGGKEFSRFFLTQSAMDAWFKAGRSEG